MDRIDVLTKLLQLEATKTHICFPPSGFTLHVRDPFNWNSPFFLGCDGPTYAPTISHSDEPSNIHSNEPSQTCFDKVGDIKFGWYQVNDDNWKDFGEKTCKWLATSASKKAKAYFCEKNKYRSFCYGTCTGLFLQL